MKSFARGELKISLKGNGRRVYMSWNGRSAERDPATLLNPYLEGLLDEIQNRELLIAFQELQFMNSSTVSPIIRFLKKLNERQVDTRITYDGRSKWQSASFKALNGLAMMMKHITVEEV